MTALWDSYRNAFPYPPLAAARRVCAQSAEPAIAGAVAGAHIAIVERGAQADESLELLNRALDHPDLDVRSRLFLLRLAGLHAVLPDTARNPQGLLDQIRALTSPSLPPAFRLIGPLLELQEALKQRDGQRLGALLAEGESILAGQPDGDATLEWRTQQLICALARHRFAQADVHLAALAGQEDRVRDITGHDLGRLRWDACFARADLPGCERLVADAADGTTRARRGLGLAVARGDQSQFERLLPLAALDRTQALCLQGLLSLNTDADERLADIVRQLRGPGRTAVLAGTGDHLAIELALRQRRPEEARFLLQGRDPLEDFGDCHAEWMRCHALLGDRAAAARHWLALGERGESYLRRALARARDLDSGDLAMITLAANANQAPPGTGSGGKRAIGAQIPDFIGASATIDLVRHHLRLVATRREPVLVIGETGCGKEIAARHLHRAGAGEDRPFVAINCAGLAESLAEAELFGHTRGAFTGAERGREGAFAQAEGGTLFLDEIGSMPLRMQSLLLRVLETGDYRPLGSNQPRQLSARIISAANENLSLLVTEGRFRADLLFRLQRLTIELPPLRAHPEDIPLLAAHFQRQIGVNRLPALGSDLLEAWLRYEWPGNVRELRNEIETMMILYGHEPTLQLKHTSVGRRSGITARFALAERTRRAEAAAPPPTIEIAEESALEPIDGPLPPGGRKVLERRRAILALLRKHGRITRSQVVANLGCAPNTATADLQALEDEGALRRILMGSSLRLSYFVLPDSSASTRSP